MAYRYLLSRVGIKSEEVLSDEMNHCWNYVLLGDNWYHVDVTWDDSGSRDGSRSRNLSRDNFLMSDAKARDKDHHDWDVRGLPPATDSTYDNRDWGDMPEKRRHDDGVPWTGFRDHVLFRAKGSGNVKRCQGKVHLRVFFVDDAESRWDDCARAAYRRVVDDVVRTLEKNGSDETGLEMTWSDENRTMDGAFSVGKAAHDAIPALLGVSGVSGVTKAQNEFKKSRGCDEAPMVFVWNRDFRSSAQQSESGSSRLRAEWATLAMEDDIVGNPHAAWHALLHELLHIFGAEDLYYPDTVKKAAEKWLPGSVMNDGDAIDDLTRVLIGWDESLSPAAVSFLDATRGVTKKEIEDAMKAEWKKKWH